MDTRLKEDIARIDQHVKILIDVVMHPAKWFWVNGVPGQFDAAEYLYQNNWDDLNQKVADKVAEVLLHSGRYIPNQQQKQ